MLKCSKKIYSHLCNAIAHSKGKIQHVYISNFIPHLGHLKGHHPDCFVIFVKFSTFMILMTVLNKERPLKMMNCFNRPKETLGKIDHIVKSVKVTKSQTCLPHACPVPAPCLPCACLVQNRTYDN